MAESSRTRRASRSAAGVNRPSRVHARPLSRLAFLTPATAVIGAFVVIPIILTVYISFHRWSMYTPMTDMTFVGVDNYRAVFTNAQHLGAIRNTAVYVGLSVIITVPLAFLLSLLLYSPRLKGSGLVRTTLFSTYVLPTIAVAITWGNLYAPYGPISAVFSQLGFDPPAWLNNPATALPALAVFNVWQLTGYYVILLVAGLTQIPEDLYESAQIDGAGYWRQVASITIPSLRSTLVFVVMMATINSIQLFDPVYLLTLGGPLNSTNVISYDVQRTAFQFGQAGEASALATALFAFAVTVSCLFLAIPARRRAR